MAQFVSCGEPHLLPKHIAFLRFLNRTFESIKQDFAHVFATIFASQHNISTHARISSEEDIALSPTKDLISAIGKKCQLNAQDWSSNDKSFGDKNGPQAVFNALDTMLKDSLEHLKMLRLAWTDVIKFE